MAFKIVFLSEFFFYKSNPTLGLLTLCNGALLKSKHSFNHTKTCRV